MIEGSLTSGERNLVINNRQLKYSGIVLLDELFNVIEHALQEKGYEKREKKAEETVTETGRNYYLELRPFKVKTNYVTLMIKIKVEVNDITDSTQDFDGIKRNFEKGNMVVSFDSWLLTDYHNRWGMKPFVYFWKALVNKWIYSYPLESGFEGELVGDTAYIYNKIKKLLNKYRKQDATYVFEKDVKKAVREEIESGWENKGEDAPN